MSILYILGHLGLGDHILCNGLVRCLASQHSQIKIPCYIHNQQAVQFMYSDLKNVEAIGIKDEAAAILLCDGKSTLRLGFYSKEPHVNGKPQFDSSKFDQEFYRQAGIPFKERWDSFKIPVAEGIGFPDNNFTFIHDDSPRGFKILLPSLKGYVYRPKEIYSFFSHVQALEGAGAVHCINSSFLILCDSLPAVESQQLYLHLYARPTHYPTLKKNWTVL